VAVGERIVGSAAFPAGARDGRGAGVASACMTEEVHPNYVIRDAAPCVQPVARKSIRMGAFYTQKFRAITFDGIKNMHNFPSG
jgi:hypothetical protein